MGACARNMQSDPAEIKPAQCCIKLVVHLTYTKMHGNTKLKFNIFVQPHAAFPLGHIHCPYKVGAEVPGVTLRYIFGILF